MSSLWLRLHMTSGRYGEHCHECWIESRAIKCGSQSDDGCLVEKSSIEYGIITDEAASDTSSEMPLIEEQFELEVYATPEVADRQWLEVQRRELDHDVKATQELSTVATAGTPVMRVESQAPAATWKRWRS